MKRLYEFGGLYVYEVYIFDTIKFVPVLYKATFNEKLAIKTVKSFEKNKIQVCYKQVLVKFDGAFSEGYKLATEKDKWRD